MPPGTSAYATSGVDIDAGNRAVALMAAAVRATHGPEVLGGLGSFGGLYDASGLKGLAQPVLVASTDGVGTKVSLAAAVGRHRSIGHDIVNHCINDILVQGARPLFFLDYIASARLAPERVAEIVGGMAEACREAGCALLGGETAEMPGVYAPEAFDVAGTIVGVVEAGRRLPRPGVAAGDVIVGLASSGPHTNGFSLIRRVFSGADLAAEVPALGTSLAETLLAPHRSYLGALWPLLQEDGLGLRALAHITGGGLLENLPRVLPEGLGAALHRGSWPVPPLFGLIQARGEVPEAEMYRVFNMGLGMLAVASAEAVGALQARLGEESWVVGEVVAGPREVRLA
jgi:phosphoribosylformylglycinamidine cyclo-ligase/phosphoribosylamine--glycine ligase/phosphoribosylformylglycinamidine cyclo-ligase